MIAVVSSASLVGCKDSALKRGHGHAIIYRNLNNFILSAVYPQEDSWY
jgi:hypothetical protein